ncbi:MAG: hypothetical protein NC900_02205 [Candidatus Omnitrophica bacterium]|nr:hypothetical protein [Candidatus Omnitrophota bacterium]
MNKKGLVLIFSVLVCIVLFILSGSLFFRTIIENDLVKRYVLSTQAFWLAEAGIAEAIVNLPNNVSGYIGDPRFSYSANVFGPFGENNLYYRINSSGSVEFIDRGEIKKFSKNLEAVIRTEEVEPTKFKYAIETTVDLIIKGSVDINPDDSFKEFSSVSFADMFGHTKEEIKLYADYLYTDPPNNVLPCEGITWIEVSEGNAFRITSNTWYGSGILIVEGDAFITGGTFDGIIYVIGKLRMSGNPVVNGAVIAESDTELVEDTTITGNVTLNYDLEKISDALNNNLKFIFVELVSWREI